MSTPIITYSSIYSGDTQEPLGSSVALSQLGSNSAIFDGPNTSSALLNRPPLPSLISIFQNGFQAAFVRPGTPPLPPKPCSPFYQAKMPYKDLNSNSLLKMPAENPLSKKHHLIYKKYKKQAVYSIPFNFTVDKKSLSKIKRFKEHSNTISKDLNNSCSSNPPLPTFVFHPCKLRCRSASHYYIQGLKRWFCLISETRKVLSGFPQIQDVMLPSTARPILCSILASSDSNTQNMLTGFYQEIGCDNGVVALRNLQKLCIPQDK